MNSLERIERTIKFLETDYVPVIAQVFGHAATIAGVGVDDYVRDGETVARCQIDALKRYGYDAVFAVLDVNVETEAVGSTLEYRHNQYPTIKQHVFQNGGAHLADIPDPARSGRMPEMLKALRRLRGELGNEVLVVGCVLGPFTLTTQLLGIENALFMAIDDPEKLELVMDFATDVIINFGRAQIEAGAHVPVVFDPSASPAVVPPQFFREFELPRLRSVFKALEAGGAIANWLHIAGSADSIFPVYANAGVDIANFDYSIAAASAIAKLPRTCLNGNIKSLSFVDDDPEDICVLAKKLLDMFKERKGFILSSGCEIPPEAKPENVAAIVCATELTR